VWRFGRQGGRNAEQAHPSAGPRQTARGIPRMNPTLLALPAAFGLAGASGLNASLPLLLISLLARLGLIQLAPPFDALQTDVAFYGILALAVVETTVDKIPALDSVGQALMVPLAATSGAIVFASQLGAIQQVDPGLQVVISLLIGGGTATAVHLTRSAVRPVLNLALLGPGASAAEDLTSGLLTLTGLLAPVLLPLVIVGMVVLFTVALRRRRRRRAQAMVRELYMQGDGASVSHPQG
jgi:Domain of unknown function (DUF4126)